ncbi:hypothetical protein IscW_ISCW011627 [Ixodes scapularis]|uniref:Uncharacterized protein n=1 Tax=Ixodes scapularis TaxID=6945 RepID=B7Q6V3_IXOSC|nr:hypothetical protein IscW_ISCW011627 [Ixodes scapularis]|eukprot:XP_002412035.1 hypothetical protein IscW_ISCW011627 [Ixodes scapularis]
MSREEFGRANALSPLSHLDAIRVSCLQISRSCRTKPENTWISTSRASARRATASSMRRTTHLSRSTWPLWTSRVAVQQARPSHMPSAEPSDEWESLMTASPAWQRMMATSQRTSSGSLEIKQ